MTDGVPEIAIERLGPMTGDRSSFAIGLLLGSIAAGLASLAIGTSLPTGSRQALMLVVGMLVMASLSALSAIASRSTASSRLLPNQRSSIHDERP